MYLNTPNAGFSQRTLASQAPSTPTNAPRMGVRTLPLSPHTPNMSMAPSPAGPFAPYQHYSLMTPPESPEKLAAAGRSSDFHPLLDGTMRPSSGFDMRTGICLSGHVLSEPAINHRVNRLILNIGPGAISIELFAGNGVFTVSDVLGQLLVAMKMPATAVEVVNAQRSGVAAPGQYPPHVQRIAILNMKYTFAGLQLTSIGNGIAYANCVLR